MGEKVDVDAGDMQQVPNGWQFIEDDEYGAYYYHENTGGTSFEYPHIIGDWTKMFDGNNQVYYYNEKTGESQWSPPIVFEGDTLDEQLNVPNYTAYTAAKILETNNVFEEEEEKEETTQNVEEESGSEKIDIESESEEINKVEEEDDDDDDDENEEKLNDDDDDYDEYQEEDDDDFDKLLEKSNTLLMKNQELKTQSSKVITKCKKEEIMDEFSYMQSVREMDIDIQPTKVLEGSEESVLALQKMQKQLEERRIQAKEEEARKRFLEEEKRKEQLRLEEEKKRITPEMKAEWKRREKILLEMEQNRKIKMNLETKKGYFNGFWTFQKSDLLIDFDWQHGTFRLPSTSSSPFTRPKFSKNGDVIKSKKLPPSPLTNSKGLEHKNRISTSANMHLRPKTVGSYDCSIYRNPDGFMFNRSLSNSGNLPPVLSHGSRPQTSPAEGYHVEKHDEALDDKKLLENFQTEINEKLKPSGQTLEDIRKSVLMNHMKKKNITFPNPIAFGPETKMYLGIPKSKIEKKLLARQLQQTELNKKKKKRKKKLKHKKKKSILSKKEEISQSSNHNVELKNGIQNFPSTTTTTTTTSSSSSSRVREKKQQQETQVVENDDLIKLFGLMDSSGDGFVSAKEMKKAIREKGLVQKMLKTTPSLKLLLNDDICDILFKAVDTDESGDVSLEEFIKVFGQTLNETPEERQKRHEFRKLFNAMDKNGDGSIDMFELRTALRTDKKVMTMIKQSPVLRPLLRGSGYHRISAIYLQFDEDQSGTLEWPEFERVCQLTFASHHKF